MEEGECFSCDKCNFKTTTETNLKQHIMKRHVIFACDICDFETAKKNTLRDHLRFIHYGITYDCELCSKRFTGKNFLREHMIQNHTDKVAKYETQSTKPDMKPKCQIKKKSVFACNQCERIFKRKDRAEEHTRWHDGLTFDCFICQTKCKRPDSLKIHIKSFHSDEQHQIQCLNCGQAFKRSDKLKNHMESVHTHKAPTRKLYECNQCERVFKHKEKAKKHARRAHNGLSFDCSICETKCARQDALKTHIKSSHSNEAYQCVNCEKTFTRKDKLKYHMKQKHKISYSEKYLCSKCEMVFMSKDKLKMHIETNHYDISHICPVCSLSFASSSELEIHLSSITHKTNVDLQSFLLSCFPCTKCDESLQSENDLKLHLKEQHGMKVRSGNEGKGVKLKRGENKSVNKEYTITPEKGEVIARSPPKAGMIEQSTNEMAESGNEKGQLQNDSKKCPNENERTDNASTSREEDSGNFSEQVLTIFLQEDRNKSENEPHSSNNTGTPIFYEKDSLNKEFEKTNDIDGLKCTNITDTYNENTRNVKKEESKKITKHTNDFESRVREILELKKNDGHSFAADVGTENKLIENQKVDKYLEESNAVQIILADNISAQNERVNESYASKKENLGDSKTQSKAVTDIQDTRCEQQTNLEKDENSKENLEKGNCDQIDIDIDSPTPSNVIPSDLVFIGNEIEILEDQLDLSDNTDRNSGRKSTKTIVFENQVVSFALLPSENQEIQKTPPNCQKNPPRESIDSAAINLKQRGALESESKVNTVQKLINANLKAIFVADYQSVTSNGKAMENKKDKNKFGATIWKNIKGKDKFGGKFLQKISLIESALTGSELEEFRELAGKEFSHKNLKRVLQDFIINLKEKRRYGNNVIIIE